MIKISTYRNFLFLTLCTVSPSFVQAKSPNETVIKKDQLTPYTAYYCEKFASPEMMNSLRAFKDKGISERYTVDFVTRTFLQDESANTQKTATNQQDVISKKQLAEKVIETIVATTYQYGHRFVDNDLSAKAIHECKLAIQDERW